MPEIPIQGGHAEFLPLEHVGEAIFNLSQHGMNGSSATYSYITREQGTAIRDALTAWLDGDPEAPASAEPSPVAQADGRPDLSPPVAGPGVPVLADRAASALADFVLADAELRGER